MSECKQCGAVYGEWHKSYCSNQGHFTGQKEQGLHCEHSGVKLGEPRAVVADIDANYDNPLGVKPANYYELLKPTKISSSEPAAALEFEVALLEEMEREVHSPAFALGARWGFDRGRSENNDKYQQYAVALNDAAKERDALRAEVERWHEAYEVAHDQAMANGQSLSDLKAEVARVQDLRAQGDELVIEVYKQHEEEVGVYELELAAARKERDELRNKQKAYDNRHKTMFEDRQLQEGVIQELRAGLTSAEKLNEENCVYINQLVTELAQAKGWQETWAECNKACLDKLTATEQELGSERVWHKHWQAANKELDELRGRHRLAEKAGERLAEAKTAVMSGIEISVSFAKEIEKLSAERISLQAQLDHCSSAYQDIGKEMLKVTEERDRCESLLRKILEIFDNYAYGNLGGIDEHLERARKLLREAK